MVRTDALNTTRVSSNSKTRFSMMTDNQEWHYKKWWSNKIITLLIIKDLLQVLESLRSTCFVGVRSVQILDFHLECELEHWIVLKHQILLKYLTIRGVLKHIFIYTNRISVAALIVQ